LLLPTFETRSCAPLLRVRWIRDDMILSVEIQAIEPLADGAPFGGRRL
jgi:hypothetical protein